MSVETEKRTHPRADGALTLSTHERDVVRELANSLTAEPSADPETFCAAAKRASRQLPERILDVLWTFARWGSTTGTLLIEGLPVGPVPSTPANNTYHLGETTLLARAQAAVNEALGSMVAYEAEGFGRLFQDMVPARAAARTQTSLSSLTELELHTEQAFSPLRPDYISLACLRGDPHAETYTLTAGQVDALADQCTKATLRRSQWMTGVDESFKSGGHTFDEGDLRGPVAILRGAEDDPFIIFDQDLMTGMTAAAAAAFEAVIHFYQLYRNHCVLKPGDLLLVDNNRAVHGRSCFHPRFDGSDRFVIRTFVTMDLARSRFARASNTRTISARFS